jgi:hypothetical protein
MSTISAGTTSTTALVSTGDTTGNLILATGATPTTALTLDSTTQAATFAGAVNFASWTTATRPASPANGQMGYNTTTNAFDAYVNSAWVSIASSATAPTSGPAFSAYQSSAQTISFGTSTKIQLQTEEFDTNSNFDSTTNYRFTPTVAGYYSFTGCVTANVSGGTYSQSAILKNGTAVAASLQSVGTGPYAGFISQKLVYMNGSTDYVELYFVSVGTGTFTTITGTANTYFQGFLARTA